MVKILNKEQEEQIEAWIEPNRTAVIDAGLVAVGAA